MLKCLVRAKNEKIKTKIKDENDLRANYYLIHSQNSKKANLVAVRLFVLSRNNEKRIVFQIQVLWECNRCGLILPGGAALRQHLAHGCGVPMKTIDKFLSK